MGRRTRHADIDVSGVVFTGAFSITPNNDANLAVTAVGIYVGGDGNVRVTTADGDDVIFVGAKAGSTLPVVATKVWATNTTATSLLGGKVAT